MSEPLALMLGEGEYARIIPKPKADANKYSRGTVGVVGGSEAYPGAAILASLAASRCGAGYVRLVTVRGAVGCSHEHLLSIPVTGCAQGEEGTLCAESVHDATRALEKSRVILVGPGLGISGDSEAFLCGLPQDRPFVIDADALTLIARNPGLLSMPAAHPRILTPHEGEAARLLGRAVEDRTGDACLLARQYDAVVLLKGHETLVATPCGELRMVAEGGPELAKAGSGDVLSGMIAAFLCQGLDAFDAASLAAFVHGRAGKYAARELSLHAVMPEDIISAIGPTLLSLES